MFVYLFLGKTNILGTLLVLAGQSSQQVWMRKSFKKEEEKAVQVGGAATALLLLLLRQIVNVYETRVS